MNQPYVLPHLIKKPGMRKTIGLPIKKDSCTTPFPHIFTSLSFANKGVNDAIGLDCYDLNTIVAVFSRINVNILIGLKNKIIAMDTFSEYAKPEDHPYFVVVKALLVSLMLGRSKTKKEIESVIKKLTSVMRPHLPNVTRVQSTYIITVDMANLTYDCLRASRSKTTKPSSTLGSDITQVSVVRDISNFFRDLIREVRLVQGIMTM